LPTAKALSSVNNPNQTRLPVDLMQPCLVVMLAHRFQLIESRVLRATMAGGGLSQI
jgi:hypothetical protein